MKSLSITFMQRSERSFLVSLILSFVLAFSVAAYLSSPFSVRVQTVKAAADTIPVDVQQDPIREPGIPFSRLNVISLIEVPRELALASSTEAMTTAAATDESVRIEKPVAYPQAATHVVGKQTSRPVRLIIPSIGLDAMIESLGLNDKGEMDVPDGSSPNVGWYKGGPIPGNMGSAVIDAHVYAAFENLRYLKVGSDVIVENARGERLRFVVDDSRVYELGELSSGMLFGRKDARRLNLITCAGQPTADGSTYTHRLVVYTKLAA